MQYGSDGKESRWGHYSTYKSSLSAPESNIDMSFKRLKEIYDGTWYKMGPREYASYDYNSNCKGFASALYNRI